MLNSFIVKVLPLFPKSFISLFSQRYIAGETLAEAVAESKKINDLNMTITMDVLGENITNLGEAENAKNICLQVLDELHNNNIKGNISLKLTQLGLKLDRSACEDNFIEILEKAKGYNNFIRIDMEDSSCTDQTIDISLKMKKRYDKVGTVVQAYLKRSENDVKMLAENGINLRICKGIYNEPASIAFKDREEIRENFIKLLKILFDNKIYVGIATHDSLLVDRAYQLIHNMKLSPEQYEFQMLLGVSDKLCKQIAEDGYQMRVYVPFGEQWYPYSIRRLKENPQMAGYIIKNLLFRN